MLYKKNHDFICKITNIEDNYSQIKVNKNKYTEVEYKRNWLK